MRVNETILFRHAGDAPFLWSQRHRALRTNRLTHAERCRLDMRLEGHLDGLRIAGEAGWRHALEQLGSARRAGTAFSAAWLALQTERDDRVEHVLSRTKDVPGSFGATISALGWTQPGLLDARLKRWVASDDAGLRALGLHGARVHRRLDVADLGPSLQHPDASVRSAAAKGARDLGVGSYLRALRELLTDGDSEVRQNAVIALARAGDADPTVVSALRFGVEAGGRHAEESLRALLELDPRHGAGLFALLGRCKETRALACVAAEARGEVESVDALISWMSEDESAHTAAEAFQTITGADQATFSAGGGRGMAEFPRGRRQEPSPLRAARWWNRRRGGFLSGVRYLDGRPIGRAGSARSEEEFQTLRLLVRLARPLHQTMAARALAQDARDSVSIETHAPTTLGRAQPESEIERAGWERSAVVRATGEKFREPRARRTQRQ
jgi:uncharacterized protein (TIGR02270 family)